MRQGECKVGWNFPGPFLTILYCNVDGKVITSSNNELSYRNFCDSASDCTVEMKWKKRKVGRMRLVEKKCNIFV